MSLAIATLMHKLTAPSYFELLQMLIKSYDGLTVNEMARQTGKPADTLEHTVTYLKHLGVITFKSKVVHGSRLNYWRVVKPYYTLVLDMIDLNNQFLEVHS